MNTTLLIVLCISLPIAFSGCDLQTPKSNEPKENYSAKNTEDATNLYYSGWLLSREAEKSDDRKHALQKYQESLDCFQTIKTKFPEWKSELVNDRIMMTTYRIANLKQAK